MAAAGCMDIKSKLRSKHDSCPCHYKENDLIQLKPDIDTPRLANLLLDKVSHKDENFGKILLLHYSLLVQKYDPDSRTRAIAETSKAKIKILNKAYVDTVRRR